MNHLNQEIIGLDTRRPVLDTTRPPYRWICSIEVEFPEPVINALGVLENLGKKWQDLPKTTKGCGSGLLIKRGKVLTCSHVVMGLKLVKDNRRRALHLQTVLPDRVRVIPGRNYAALDPAPFQVWQSARIEVNPTFKKLLSQKVELVDAEQVRQALQTDIGFIDLKPKYRNDRQIQVFPGDLYGWWNNKHNCFFKPVSDQFRKSLYNRMITVCGFPGDKGEVDCGQMYLSRNKVITPLSKIQGRTANPQITPAQGRYQGRNEWQSHLDPK